MKTKTILSLCLAASLAACDKPEPASPSSDGSAAEAVHPTLPAAGAVEEGSIHDLDSKWRDQNAEEGTLAEHLGGKVQVISMGYSTCKFACPALVADMRRIRDGIDKAALGARVGFVFISIDPETDTPARLKEFEKESGFDPALWKLLSGDADDVLELAVVFGMKYRKTTVDDFAHSNIITLVGADGVVLHQQTGINTDPAKTLAAIGAALAAGDN